jgi:hypothetical protein
VRAAIQENVQPVIRRLRDNPQLMADHEAWRVRRTALRSRISAGDPDAVKQAVGRDYYLGRYADGDKTLAEHVIKMRLKAPIDERGDG